MISRLAALLLTLTFAAAAPAQTSTKKELAQKVLQLQQSEIEVVARTIVERPAAQMLQQAGMAMQMVPADKREAVGKAIDSEVKKYVDEAYPLVRERALRIAPGTVGAALEEKLSEDELKQLVAWLTSPANKKYQQVIPEMREMFVKKLLADAQPVVDPKLKALDASIRSALGAGPASVAPTGASASAAPARAAAPAKKASAK